MQEHGQIVAFGRLYCTTRGSGGQTQPDSSPNLSSLTKDHARPNEGRPRFRRISFSHITARDAQYAAAFLVGLPEMPIEDVWFEDISVSLAEDAPSGHPDMAPGFGPFQRAGFFAQHVRGLRLQGVRIAGHVGEPWLLNDVTSEISA